jgi:hypothetical protein
MNASEAVFAAQPETKRHFHPLRWQAPRRQGMRGRPCS